MLKRHKIFNLIYLVVMFLNIYAEVAEIFWLKVVALPLIGISLLIYLLARTKISDRFQQLVFFGLVLAMAGDVQLLFRNQSDFYLISALFATSLSYIFYARACYLDFRRNRRLSLRVGNLLLCILLLANTTYLVLASRNFGDMKICIMVTLALSTIMCVLAGYRYKRINDISFKLMLAGCFALVISDLSIGYHMFIETEKSMMLAYLLTYLIGQYHVIMGTIERRP